jgi:histidyl-tRNA synthetase
MSSPDAPVPGPDARARAAALQGRWIRSAWRRAALLHAFEEVDALVRAEEAPTSGEAVDLGARAARALIPPALDAGAARAFAIRHWDHRERPQRARDAQFWCFSARILHDEGVRADAAAIALAVEPLRALGLTHRHAKVRISHRDAVRSLLQRRGVAPEDVPAWTPLLHEAGKMSNDDFISGAGELGMEARVAVDVLRVLNLSTPFEAPTTQLLLSEQAGGRGPEYFKALFAELRALGIDQWCVLNLGIVRRGPHHSGMVFEVHDAAGRGRSIAGGGRSMHMIADREVSSVGFDMGDTSLAELLGDAGAMPAAAALADIAEARCQAVVGAVDTPDTLAAVVPLVADLRRAGVSAAALDEPVPDLGAAQAAARRTGPGAAHAVVIESALGDGVRVARADAPSSQARVCSIPDVVAYLAGARRPGIER